MEALEIYLFGPRMFIIMEVNEHFSFEAKGRADQSNPKVQEWENLMWRVGSPGSCSMVACQNCRTLSYRAADQCRSSMSARL
jgi:hypothetical protein